MELIVSVILKAAAMDASFRHLAAADVLLRAWQEEHPAG